MKSLNPRRPFANYFSRLCGLVILACVAVWFDNTNLNAQDEVETPTPATQQQTETPAEAKDLVNPPEKQTTKPSKQEKGDATGEEKIEPFTVLVAKEAIEFTASGTWKQVTPKSGMIEAEITIPKLGDDQEDGRLTIMGAGGTIEANIARWQGQFVQEDGEPVEAKTEVKSICNHEVHVVDISGTYMDMPGGPFAGGKAIERENYRMLAAIIKTAKHGNYFVKLYGPQNTIKQNKENFEAMIESLKVVPADSNSDSDLEKSKKHGPAHPSSR
jgi:hypothetical protein